MNLINEGKLDNPKNWAIFNTRKWAINTDKNFGNNWLKIQIILLFMMIIGYSSVIKSVFVNFEITQMFLNKYNLPLQIGGIPAILGMLFISIIPVSILLFFILRGER